MRRGMGGFLTVVLALVGTAVSAPARAADDVIYWPRREITFPVPVEKIQAMTPRPTKLRFYVTTPRGKWEVVDERTVEKLEVLDREKNRRGFRYTSASDGEYEFASQYAYADGDEHPPRSELTAQYRVVFDTRPPVVRLAATGKAGVEWDIRDDNLHPDGVELQVRWVGQSKWVTRQPRAFSSRDSYTWTDLTSRQPLEVRILAKDRAGHEGASQVITLPTSGSGSGLEPAEPMLRNTGGTGTGRSGSGFGNPDEFPVQPQIEYANTRSLVVESRLTRVTRSGVKSANLWVNDGKGAWRFEKTEPLSITTATIEPVIKISYEAKADGLYGFIVIPVNGAGGKQDDPKRDDPPQFLIEVDTVKPVVKVTSHKVSPGGAVGPRVELEWSATDKNLMNDPVVIEYGEGKNGDPKSVQDWKPVHAGKLSNSGRYAWEVEDKDLWKFFVRVRAVDKAGNAGEHLYEKEIHVDTDVPAARIEKVQGSGGSSPPHESERRPVDPKPTTPPGGSPPSGAPTPVPKLPGI